MVIATIVPENRIVIDPRVPGGMAISKKLSMSYDGQVLKMGPRPAGYEGNPTACAFYPDSTNGDEKYCIIVDFGGKKPISSLMRYGGNLPQPVISEINDLELIVEQGAQESIARRMPRNIVAFVVDLASAPSGSPP
jgi:hypothetical protein